MHARHRGLGHQLDRHVLNQVQVRCLLPIREIAMPSENMSRWVDGNRDDDSVRSQDLRISSTWRGSNSPQIVPECDSLNWVEPVVNAGIGARLHYCRTIVWWGRQARPCQTKGKLFSSASQFWMLHGLDPRFPGHLYISRDLQINWVIDCLVDHS